MSPCRPTVHRHFDSRVRSGFVISQSPAPHTRVAENTDRWPVWLSLGPPPVAVPQLAGEQVSTAEARLAQLGLNARRDGDRCARRAGR